MLKGSANTCVLVNLEFVRGTSLSDLPSPPAKEEGEDLAGWVSAVCESSM